MVVTLLHVPDGKIFTLPAVPYDHDQFSDKNRTAFHGLQALMEVLGFSVEEHINLGSEPDPNAEMFSVSSGGESVGS
jgi:hypothetical protein